MVIVSPDRQALQNAWRICSRSVARNLSHHYSVGLAVLKCYRHTPVARDA
jgi:hypothetical protein